MTKKKLSDYNLHAAIIALSVGAGILLAACSPMMSGSQDAKMPAASPSPIATVPPESLQGSVKGASSETLEQQLDEIDQAMYRVPEE